MLYECHHKLEKYRIFYLCSVLVMEQRGSLYEQQTFIIGNNKVYIIIITVCFILKIGIE